MVANKSASFDSLAETGDKIEYMNEIEDGLPAGGYVLDTEARMTTGQAGRNLSINWQDGPCDRNAGEYPNGAFVEDLLEVCRLRLKFYYESGCKGYQNALAGYYIEKSLTELKKRRESRKEKGILGKNEA